jgi:16S rRNA processing protein RimM
LPNRPILLGVIGRAHGVRGLVRVTSHTADPADLIGYGPLSDPSGRRFVLRWIGKGIAEIAEIINGEPVKIADRAAAERLTNTKLFIERDRLPAPEDDEYYLADLIGLAAVAANGMPIGVISAVHDYGGGVSLEVDRDNAGSLLIPFTAVSVPEVNIAAGRMTVVPPDEIDVMETAAADARHLTHDRRPPAHTLAPQISPQRHPRACPEGPTRHDVGTGPNDEHGDDEFTPSQDGHDAFAPADDDLGPRHDERGSTHDGCAPADNRDAEIAS